MASRVLVVGSGAIGLRTVSELLRRNVRVCLFSPRHPLHPSTCSAGAGGLWMPFHCDDPRTGRWARETLSELVVTASPGSIRDDRPLVEILPAVSFKRDGHPRVPSWATDVKSKSLAFQHVNIDELYEGIQPRYNCRLPSKDVMEDAGYTHAWFFQTPIVDAPKMLTHMLEEIKSSPHVLYLDLETDKYYGTVEEMAEEARALGFDGLVNCTGMGSRQLCDDDALVGARGVLLHFDRASCAWSERLEHADRTPKDSVIMIEEPPFGSETAPCYMIPRGAVVTVGGTYLEGDREGSVRRSERQRLIENAHVMGIDVDKTKPVGEWVGFRPYRPTARLEVDEGASSAGGVRVVHSYGYGGSGWTVFAGAAREAAALL